MRLARFRTACILSVVAPLATALTLSIIGAAQAVTVSVKDPGTDWGHGANITRLSANNGQHRVRIAIRYRHGANAKYTLSAVHPKFLESASVIIRRAADGNATAHFWILEPESAGNRYRCKGLRSTWRPTIRRITVSFPQSCYEKATGSKVPPRWFFTAFTGGQRAGDNVITKRIRRG